MRLFCFVFLIGIIHYLSVAQDVTLSGPVPCGAAPVTGTWTVPCDVTAIRIEVYGGGGGAGGGGGGSNGGFFPTRGGGGGGGGGYTSITINVTPGATFNYAVGAGGCGGNGGSDGNSGTNGTNGGNSTFSGTAADGTPVNLVANGGIRGTTGSGTGGSPGSGGAGGTASGGTTNLSGGNGSNGSGGNGGPGGAGAGPAGGAGGATTAAPGNAYGGGGAGGGDSPGGRGGTGAILITYTSTNPIPAPLVAVTQPTCSAIMGTATIGNYDAAKTYIFTPAGPTVGPGGIINGLNPGTTYTVIAREGSCDSAPSDTFSIAPQTNIAVPIISTTPPTCTSNGTATITNYNPSLNYLFTPPGPTAGSGGVIDGLTTGTSYTVIASDGICSSSSSAPFSIGAQFPPVVAQIAGPLSYCTGGNVTLTASGGNNYFWTDAGGNLIGNNASITVTQGTYYVLVTDANGCADTASATVTEISNLTVNISGNLSYCPGGNTTITASGGSTYQWSNGSNSPTITVTSGNYSVTASDASGCTGTASVTITAYSAPVINISGTLNYCPGNNTTLTASGATSYIWNDAAGSTAASITVTQGNYTVTGTDANGCTATASVSVTENPLPTITISGFLSHCPGESTTITASGGVAYQWSTGVTTASVNVTEGNYTVTVTDANGCQNTENVTVSLAPKPVADFSVNPDCAGKPVIFQNHSIPTGLNYSWDFGNGFSSTDHSPVITFAQSGTYTVQLIVSNGGCADTITKVLQIYTQPTAAFTANPLRVILKEETVLFTNSSNGADTYLWDFGDGQQSNDFEPRHIYNQAGIYTISLIASNQQGCSDTISKVAYIEVYEKPVLFIPNAFSPNGDGVNDVFYVYGSGFKEFYLAIFNRWGQLVFEAEDPRSGWNGTLNGKEMEQAVYVYYIKAAFADLTVRTFKGSLTLLR